MHQRSLRQGAAMTKRPITLTFAALALAGLLGACSGGSDDGDAARVAINARVAIAIGRPSTAMSVGRAHAAAVGHLLRFGRTGTHTGFRSGP
jgi:hypothetical protein